MRYDYKGFWSCDSACEMKWIGEATERMSCSPEPKNHRKEGFNLVRFGKAWSRQKRSRPLLARRKQCRTQTCHFRRSYETHYHNRSI